MVSIHERPWETFMSFCYDLVLIDSRGIPGILVIAEKMVDQIEKTRAPIIG